MWQYPIFSIYVNPDAEVVEASANGKQIENIRRQDGVRRWWALQYYGVPKEGIEMALTMKAPSQ